MSNIKTIVEDNYALRVIDNYSLKLFKSEIKHDSIVLDESYNYKLSTDFVEIASNCEYVLEVIENNVLPLKITAKIIEVIGY